jgi:penicillin-binding protein 1A
MAQQPPDNSYSAEDLERYFNDPEYRRQKAREKENLEKEKQETGEPKKKKEKKPLLSKRVRRYLIVGTILFALCASYGVYLVSGLPSLQSIENPKPELATKVFSVDGEILDQFYFKNRSQVPLREIPQTVVHALVATEDKNFYSHWGVDLIRFMKAMVKTVFGLRGREGASTITQQLSRSLYLGMDDRHVLDTITRKLREWITAIQLEKNFTKEEILEFYLNVVYFGRGCYGIGSAAQVYFGKDPADLTLTESATLVAMLRGPALYDPANHPERSRSRRNLVLSQMEKDGYLTSQQAAEAKGEETELRASDDLAATGIAPHFVESIRRQMMQKAEKYGFDLYRDGISVYTTVDSRMQRHANRAVEEHLDAYQKLFEEMWDWRRERDALKRVIDQAIWTSAAYRNASSQGKRDSIYDALKSDRQWVDSMKVIAKRVEVGFVVLDPNSGHVLAMVGGSNFRNFKYGFNHATQIRRQAGSAFKPFVYTVAIDNGFPPTYELLNQPVTIMMADGNRWSPANSDGRFGGKSTIREAIRMSINLVAVRAIMEIAPVNLVIDYAKRMGINSPLPPVESLALGSGEVSPLDMASAFGVFANGGIYIDPVSILRIEDKDGNLIEENYPMQREVLGEETAFIMTSMLQDVVNGGTGTHVRDFFQLPAAGKTGTTDEFADAWFIGFTPHLSSAVWVGFDNKSVHFTTWDGQGGRAAAPIFGRFMKYVYEDPDIGMPLDYFKKPEAVFADTICVDTKKLATEYCPVRVVEYFTEKTRPGKCDRHSSELWKEGDERVGTISF